jgi:hypothetical protein
MKDKIIAVSSIGFMLFAASAVLFDRLLLAYAIALVYAIVRWKISEQNGLVVKSETAKWCVRIFIVICCVLFAAGGGHFSSIFEGRNPAMQGAFAFIGFAFAYDIGRFFSRVVKSGKSGS